MKKKIAILGSTGSVGRNACAVAVALRDEVEVVALAAGSDADALAPQAAELGARYVSLADEAAAARLRDSLDGRVEILPPAELLDAALADGVELVVNAISGFSGLDASEKCLKAGKVLALANKESLVAAGELLVRLASEHGGRILPVDSEHSAVFQSLLAGRREEVSRIILTASGGPFRTRADLSGVTVEEALAHPTWNMGRKITIDSATMMNKALEVIEAHWLFDLPARDIEVVLHPQSIVHGLVRFVDGSLVAQMGPADMKLPIQYALTYPERRALDVEPLDLAALGKLEFAPVDHERFLAVRLAEQVIKTGGTAGAALNAANEEAVKAFLAGGISFTDIAESVRCILDAHNAVPVTEESVRETDTRAREEFRKWQKSRC